MSYIKTTITDYGTNESFATALKEFFVNNEVAQFELISEDSAQSYPIFTVQRNNLSLKFEISSTSFPRESRLEVSTKNSNGEYVENFAGRLTHNAADTLSPKAFKILLIENNGTIVLQIANCNAVSISTGITIVDTVLNNGVNLIGSNSYSSSGTTLSLKDTELQLVYSPRAFHTGSNDEATLILSNQLAINQNNGVYYSDTIGLISAGGAKQFGYYITSSNSYYGVLANVCIPMGDRVEYATAE